MEYSTEIFAQSGTDELFHLLLIPRHSVALHKYDILFKHVFFPMQNISFWLFKVAIYVLNRNFLNIETFYFHSQVWKHHNKRFLELKKILLKSKYQLIHLTRNTLTSYLKKKSIKKHIWKAWSLALSFWCVLWKRCRTWRTKFPPNTRYRVTHLKGRNSRTLLSF